jgi:hypothetical protein
VIQRVAIKNNPCRVEIIPDIEAFQKYLAFGTDGTTLSPEELETELEKKAQQGMFTLYWSLIQAKRQGFTSSLSKIFWVYDIECPRELKGRGYGSKALAELEQIAASYDRGYECIMADAVTNDGHNLLKRNNYTQVFMNYYVKKLG